MRTIPGSVFTILLLFFTGNTQAQSYSHQDTLRGSVDDGRKKWDVLHYNITVQPDITSQTIKGINRITIMDSGATRIQLDLQEPMLLDSVICENNKLSFSREGNVYWVELTSSVNRMHPCNRTLSCFFHGQPRKAVMPPWDGGWVWTKDSLDNPWVSVACQGLGASVWLPCKDIQSDEPDSGCTMTIIVPDTLQAIGNGRLYSTEKADGHLMAYTWKTISPINSYNIIPYIGKYVRFSEKYEGLKGRLDLDYWVLGYNLDKARVHFSDVRRMMRSMEYWLGPYPFYEDGYKLVEAPYLGMEHQSAVAYGNKYRKGYLGSDRSGTGWGLKWDFIIIHESGHEWFGNSITSKDIADMWIHESFTNYTETLFTSYYYGKKAGNEYVAGLRGNIRNDKPVIGPYGVNKEGSSDMYDKGANMIHMIRLLMRSDRKFRALLQDMNTEFFHQTVTTEQIEDFISRKSGLDLSKLFDQYLRHTEIPELRYHFENNQLTFYWANTVGGFSMPVKVSINHHKEKWIYPETGRKSISIKFAEANTLKVDQGFYVNVKSY